MAWMYRLVPKLPKQMRPKKMIVLHHVGRRSGLAREAGLQRTYHDADSDGRCSNKDNCPYVSNFNQVTPGICRSEFCHPVP